MQAILLTTDLSDESRLAFKTAVEYARVFKARVLLLAVIEDLAQAAMVYAMDFPVLPDPDIQKQLVEKVRNELQEIARTEFSEVDCEIFVEEARGPVHSEIIHFAHSHNVDLIIMATHGRTGISRLVIGSVAEKVVREGCCPVLTVPVKTHSHSDR